LSRPPRQGDGSFQIAPNYWDFSSMILHGISSQAGA
jgi:hypothetical protein